MPRDFFPRAGTAVLGFTANFRNQITAHWQAYNVPLEWVGQYTQLQEAYAQAYQRAASPSTCSRTATRAKADAHKALERMTRQIVGRIRGSQSVTSAMRVVLGIPPGNTPRRRIGPPKASPGVNVISMQGHTLTLKLSDLESPTNRGKPKDVTYAVVWIHLGDRPPADVRDWTMWRMTTRVRNSITVSDSYPPGTKLWITAQWGNRKGKTGPISRWVMRHIQFDGGPQIVRNLLAA